MPHDFKKFPELRDNQMQIYYWDSPHKQITENFVGKVVKVHDGDTIKVRTDFRDFDFPIRLAYIAAPELNEVGGRRSRDWLAEQILNEEINILVNPHNRVGKWGRLIGTIMFMGMNLNQMSKDTGHSVPFGDSIWY